MRRRRRRREVDVEGHGAAERWAKMFEPLVVTTENLGAADLCGFGFHDCAIRFLSLSSFKVQTARTAIVLLL